MLMAVDDALVWDAGNLAHLAARNAARRARGRPEIAREEADALYDAGRFEAFGQWRVDARGVEQWQVRLVGRTPAGHYVTIACELLDDGGYRPITLWPSSRREIAAYRRLNPDDQDND
jgi:hypothetical protein